MSIWARHWALAQSVGGEGASRAARRCVLLDLADWMIGDDATECRPTIETLAFDTGFNRQTVMKALAALVEQGLVTRRYEWEGLKKFAYYRFVGYVPKEWQGSLRPDSAHPEGPRFKTSENTDIRNPEGTKSRTTEGTKSHTSQGTKSRTHEGTKSRTVPGSIHGITRNSHGVGSAHAETTCLDTNPNPAQFEGVPFPDFEETSDDELFAAELIKADKAKAELAPEPEAKPKSRTRKTTAKKADAWPVEDDGVDADTREAYLSVRKAKRVGPFTPKAYEQLAKQATKHGVSVKVALEKCIESGWVFPYDSLFEKEKNHGKTQQSQQKSAFLRPQSEIDYTYGLDRWNRA